VLWLKIWKTQKQPVKTKMSKNVHSLTFSPNPLENIGFQNRSENPQQKISNFIGKDHFV